MRTQRTLAAIALLLTSKAPAAAPDEPWFNPSGGTWVPDAAVVSDMKVALDSVLAAALAAKSSAGQPPTRYWFQYLGLGFGADKAIELIGQPFSVSPGATTQYFSVFIPEICVVHARYSPTMKKIQDLSVGGIACPPRV